VSRESLNLIELVRGDQNRGLTGVPQKTLDDLIAYQGIESAERLIENQQPRPKRQCAGQREFQPHPVRERADPALGGQLQPLTQLVLGGAIPTWVARARIVEELRDPQPAG
jgi:hypothetical protein